MSQRVAQLMMDGCEGQQDYLVVTKLGSAAIGLKPVIEERDCQEKGPLFLIGVRVRLAAAPGKALLNAKHVANTLCSAIPWEKQDVDHCSVFAGFLLPPFPSDMTPETFIAELVDAGFFAKILERLNPLHQLGGRVYATKEDINRHLQKQYAIISQRFLSKPSPSSGSGKVIPFKPC